MLDFLQLRLKKEIEAVEGQTYRRTVALGQYRGWVSVSPLPARHALRVEFTLSLTPVLPALLRSPARSARPELRNSELRLTRSRILCWHKVS
ncbi:AlkA N-terminal domain-containing protein [Pantoea ananatis]